MYLTAHLIFAGGFLALAVLALLVQLLCNHYTSGAEQQKIALILLMAGVAAGLAAVATLPALPN